MNKYNKYYYEEYAKITLEFIFPDKIRNFIHADKPDIQNQIDDIGIEVTRSDPEELLETERYGIRFLGEKPTKQQIEKFGGEFFFDNEGVVRAFSSTKGLTTPLLSEDIVSSIEKKRKKYESYKKFKSMGLYCFNEFLASDSDIKEIAKIDIKPFDFLIINSLDVIYMIKNGTYEAFELSDDQLRQIKPKALNNLKAY